MSEGQTAVQSTLWQAFGPGSIPEIWAHYAKDDRMPRIRRLHKEAKRAGQPSWPLGEVKPPLQTMQAP